MNGGWGTRPPQTTRDTRSRKETPGLTNLVVILVRINLIVGVVPLKTIVEQILADGTTHLDPGLPPHRHERERSQERDDQEERKSRRGSEERKTPRGGEDRLPPDPNPTPRLTGDNEADLQRFMAHRETATIREWEQHLAQKVPLPDDDSDSDADMESNGDKSDGDSQTAGKN
ncbi:hypothetical protein N7528_007809 [Penicillium herquei]|nr:hypothetical protein N7528_007809 [Penicillium herquei]